ncbi:MAG: LssY C-terminal domain-containing protein, partial [Lysobacterales bacterium]
QVAAEPSELAALLSKSGWQQVPDTDWRWVLQALNPEANSVTLPLLGRAYQGAPEDLLLKKMIGRQELVTLRLWDSGVRLAPEGRVLYLGQMVEEVLVQRFGLFSYWRAVAVREPLVTSLQQALPELDRKFVDDGLLLIR